RLVPAKSTTRRSPAAPPLDFNDWLGTADVGAGFGTFGVALAPLPLVALAGLLDPPQPATPAIHAVANVAIDSLLLPTRAPIICSLLVTYPRNIAAATTGSPCCATFPSRSPRARSSLWSVRRAAARRRSSACSRGSTRRAAAPCCSTTRT